MQIHRTVAEARAAMRRPGRLVLVPTMGNLHAGHLRLMREARAHGDSVAATIFVNRTQFGPAEDFDRYPRTFEQDCEKLRASGVGHLFAPDEAEMYPRPQSVFVSPPAELDSILEGRFRPGHFRGVATVVLKLFEIAQPAAALFGRKDYQQLLVIRRMVEELNVPVDIVGCETEREQDGLALSSRNAYLSPAARAEAPRLIRVLRRLREAALAGEHAWERLERSALDELAANGWQPDYVSVRRRDDLGPPSTGPGTLVALAAARLDSTRLIDNLEF
jgi:pantoate--beta-alanine ligase